MRLVTIGVTLILGLFRDLQSFFSNCIKYVTVTLPSLGHGPGPEKDHPCRYLAVRHWDIRRIIMKFNEAKKSFTKFLLLFTLFFLIGGCDFLEKSSDKPWLGYAFNKSENKLRWWYDSFGSHEECIKSMERGVTETKNATRYSMPVGCGYTSNSRVKVIIMNGLFARSEDFQCITKSRSSKIRKMKMSVSPVLNGYPETSCTSG